MISAQVRPQLMTFKVLLFLVLLAHPVLLGQTSMFQNLSNFYNGFAFVLYLIMAISGGIALLTSSHIFGYGAMLALGFSAFLFDSTSLVFAIRVWIGLTFAEGMCGIGPYQSVLRKLRTGPRENVTSNLQRSFVQFYRRFLLVAALLGVSSVLLALLPEIVPLGSDLPALGLYVTIGLVGIALAIVYLGSKE